MPDRPTPDSAFRVSFVQGVMPDKWARAWRDRLRDPLELSMVDDDDQVAVLRDGRADMCFVRLPIDRDGLHVIPLYREVPVVVVPKDHLVTAVDEVSLADLADEQLIQDPATVPGWADVATAERLDWPSMTTKEAVEVVASGTGIVIVPMSVARLHHRKDVAHRPVTDVPESQVGLAWLVANEDPRTETFVGIVRGRTARSSRETETPPKAVKKPLAPAKKAARRTGKPVPRLKNAGRRKGRR